MSSRIDVVEAALHDRNTFNEEDTLKRGSRRGR